LATGLARPEKPGSSANDSINDPPNLLRAETIIVESVDEDGRPFRSTAKWASLTTVHDQLF
jgi:hypothetical protein